MNMKNHWSQRVQWEETPTLCPRTIETDRGKIGFRRGRFLGGPSDSVDVIEIDSGSMRVVVLPSRGMGLWQLESEGVRFGWDAPVWGPVHPSLVPLSDPSGLGWLEGFDELLVRCGLESNGAPEFDQEGRLRYPLHGRVANLPAQNLTVEIDVASGRLTLTGEVLESRMFFKRLRLKSQLIVTAGESRIEVEDIVTNELSRTATMQMLYHLNIGKPVLGKGAELIGHFESVEPKDALSAGERERWHQVEGPQKDYHERVYFTRLRADSQGYATAVLRSADRESGLGVRFQTDTLPHFVVWKNTGLDGDGYVVGMEPSTNLPNERSVEEAAGRIVSLQPNEQVTFRLELHPMVHANDVDAMVKECSL